MNMQFQIHGASSYTGEQGQDYTSLFYLEHAEPDNQAMKGFCVNKIASTRDVFQRLSSNNQQYPLTIDAKITPKRGSGGKTVMCVTDFSLVTQPAKQSTKAG